MNLAQALLWHGLAQTTRRSYLTGRRSYERFCAQHGFGGDPWPATSDAVCLWIGFLFHRGLSFATIKHYLAGVSSSHTDLGLSSSIPSDDRIARVLRGVKLLRGARSALPPKLPITLSILRRLHDRLDPSLPDHRMLSAAMWLGTTALLRTGEFAIADATKPDAHRLLRLSDISSANGRYFLTLRASKTDPFRVGVTIPILSVEAVAALRRYLSRRPTQRDGPLFVWSSGRPLSRADIVAFVSHLIDAAKIPW